MRGLAPRRGTAAASAGGATGGTGPAAGGARPPARPRGGAPARSAAVRGARPPAVSPRSASRPRGGGPTRGGRAAATTAAAGGGASGGTGRVAGAGRDGFLLVEALATLLLSALILAGLAGVLALMVRAGDRLAARVDAAETSRALVMALTRDLAPASRARWPAAAPGEAGPYVFSGDAGTLTFARETDAGSVLVTYLAAAGGLTRTATPLPPGAAGTAELAAGVPETVSDLPVRFAYVGRGAAGAVESWPSGPAMPAAVEVAIAGTGTRIALRIDADVGCLDARGGGAGGDGDEGGDDGGDEAGDDGGASAPGGGAEGAGPCSLRPVADAEAAADPAAADADAAPDADE